MSCFHVLWLSSCPFLKILFIYSWETQRERETQTEGEAGFLQGPQCGARFQSPGITTWAKGRRSTTEPRRRPPPVHSEVWDSGATYWWAVSCCLAWLGEFHLYLVLFNPLPMFNRCPKKRVALMWYRFFFFLPLFFFLRFYLSIHERHTQRERETQRYRQREKQTLCREPDVGPDPGSPGSDPGLKAALNLWATRAAPLYGFNLHFPDN